MPLMFEPEYFDATSSGLTPALEFSTKSGLQAIAQDAFATNPLQAIRSRLAVDEARGNPDDFEYVKLEDMLGEDGAGSYRGRTYLSVDEQSEIIRENNLQSFLKPQIGETRESLIMLMDLKREEMTRNFIAANSGVGLTGQITMGLLASMFDPINLGSAFVPIVGAARYAGMLAKQADRIGRASVRARTGAIEGAVGALAVEPLVYFNLQNTQTDYNLYDSFANLAFGAGFGAGLRTGGGLIGDILTNPQAHPNETAMAQAIATVGPEAQADIARVAVGQLLSGRRVVGTDIMLRTALENTTAVGRVRDVTMQPDIRMADGQPLPVRGDYILETSADGTTKRTPVIKVELDNVQNVDKAVDDLAANGVETRVTEKDDGTIAVDALLPNFLINDDQGQLLKFGTKKEATAEAKRLNKEGAAKKAEPIKIGQTYFIADSDNPFALNILKKSTDKAVVPDTLPVAIGRLSVGDDGLPYWSPDVDYTASTIKDANSPEGYLFEAAEKDIAKLADEIDALDQITPEQIATDIAEKRALIERAGNKKDLARFDAEQQEAQKNIDDIKEQEAAIKDAFECAIQGL